MIILTNREKKFFKDNGYLHLKSVIKKKKILNFKKTFFDILDNYSGLKTKRSFNNSDLVLKVKKFRKKNKKKFFHFFRTISLTTSFNDLFNCDAIKDISSQLIKTKKTNLIIGESQFRMDEPKDKFYNLDWHQDASHYKMDSKGRNSLVINITVQNQFKDMGTPLLKAGSHKSGIYKIYTPKGKSKVLQLKPSKKIIEINKHIIKYVNSNPGDIVIYDMKLLHKYGFNYSKKIRISVLARVFDPMNKNFKPFRYITQLLN